jgi:uncharacterized membrane protein
MRRLVHTLLLGLLGAGIVHIVVLFLIPELSERDTWSRLEATADLYAITPLVAERGGGTPVVKSVDPLFRAVACRFDLDDGMTQIKAPGKVPFWSVSIYDRNGHDVYSFNDRSAEKGVLDTVVLTPAQMIAVRKDLPVDLVGSVFVETEAGEGIAVIRAFVPDDSWKPAVERFLAQASCASQTP